MDASPNVKRARISAFAYFECRLIDAENVLRAAGLFLENLSALEDTRDLASSAKALRKVGLEELSADERRGASEAGSFSFPPNSPTWIVAVYAQLEELAAANLSATPGALSEKPDAETTAALFVSSKDAVPDVATPDTSLSLRQMHCMQPALQFMHLRGAELRERAALQSSAALASQVDIQRTSSREPSKVFAGVWSEAFAGLARLRLELRGNFE